MNTGEKRKVLSTTDRINSYISDARGLINAAQNVINTPRKENFDSAMRFYSDWLSDVRDFIFGFDETKASELFSAPDGVRVLTQHPGRIRNIYPQTHFYYEEDGNTFVDDKGIETIKNMILSLREKIQILTDFRAQKKRAISRDANGDYWYKGGKLPFRKNTIYYLIFEYLFELGDQEASYNKIDAYLVINGKGRRSGKHKQSERIRNAIRAYEANTRLPKIIGKYHVLEIKSCHGIRLNNPET